RRMREAERLERVRRVLRLAGVDVAIAAGAGARVAQDLEGGCAAAPALGDVRAARLLADRVQRLSVDELPDVEVARVGARRANLHPFRPARPLGDGQRLLHPPECSRGPDRPSPYNRLLQGRFGAESARRRHELASTLGVCRTRLPGSTSGSWRRLLASTSPGGRLP